jgi:hypothetical protein
VYWGHQIERAGPRRPDAIFDAINSLRPFAAYSTDGRFGRMIAAAAAVRAKADLIGWGTQDPAPSGLVTVMIAVSNDSRN